MMPPKRRDRVPERQTLEHLLQTLDPETLEEGVFLGQNTHPDGQRLYGGQVLAQVLRAAVKTVAADRKVHSQHAYFLRPGNPAEPVTLEVENARDGGSFSSRRVVALQQGKPILVSSMSFQVPEQGDEYAPEMPAVPGPQELKSERERELAQGSLNPDFQVVSGLDLDVRLVEPVDWSDPTPREPVLYAWMKTTGPVGSGAGLHEALLAYMSDAFLIDVALITHGRDFHAGMQCASLDHALWFHAPFRADEWLLHVTEGQRIGGGRGLSRGQFFREDGTLVATCMQESLMRLLQ
jgi:acyl-CoA thioesterase-2